MINKISSLLLTSSFCMLLGLNSALAQEETVTVDTLITTSEDGKTIQKLIIKKTVKSGSKSEAKTNGKAKVLRKKKKMLFIGDGENVDHEVMLQQIGGDSESTDIEIIMNNDGSSSMEGMNMGESLIWINSDDRFSFESTDPLILQKEARSQSLAKLITMGKNNIKRTELEKELDLLLDEIFDLKLENKEKNLQARTEILEKEMESLRKRRSSKSEMIKDRKAELLEEKSEKLRW